MSFSAELEEQQLLWQLSEQPSPSPSVSSSILCQSAQILLIDRNSVPLGDHFTGNFILVKLGVGRSGSGGTSWSRHFDRSVLDGRACEWSMRDLYDVSDRYA